MTQQGAGAEATAPSARAVMPSKLPLAGVGAHANARFDCCCLPVSQVLEALKGAHEFVALMLEYRKVHKIKTGFAETLRQVRQGCVTCMTMQAGRVLPLNALALRHLTYCC